MFLFIDFLEAHIRRDETKALAVVDQMTEPEARHLNQMLQNTKWDPQALLLKLKRQKKGIPAKRSAILSTIHIPAKKKVTQAVPVRAKKEKGHSCETECNSIESRS
ncbi:MAG: hypothetical protein ACO3DD_10685 [Burkholderiaceae bacterium]